MSPLRNLSLGRASLTLGLIDPLLEVEDLPPVPPVNTIGDSGTFSLAYSGGYGGMFDYMRGQVVRKGSVRIK